VFICQGLCFSHCRDNIEAAIKASCGSLAGVGKTMSETDQGIAETWESLPPPHVRTRIDGQPRDQGTGLLREFAAPGVAIRISSRR